TTPYNFRSVLGPPTMVHLAHHRQVRYVRVTRNPSIYTNRDSRESPDIFLEEICAGAGSGPSRAARLKLQAIGRKWFKTELPARALVARRAAAPRASQVRA